MKLETIRIERDGPRGWKRINLCDFDASRHIEYVPADATKDEAEAALARLGVKADRRKGVPGLLADLRKAQGRGEPEAPVSLPVMDEPDTDGAEAEEDT